MAPGKTLHLIAIPIVLRSARRAWHPEMVYYPVIKLRIEPRND